MTRHSITYEVPAIIKRGAVGARVDEEVWRGAIHFFEPLGPLIIGDSDAEYEAMRLAINYRCFYFDAPCLLLAEDLGCPFATTDDKLCRGYGLAGRR